MTDVTDVEEGPHESFKIPANLDVQIWRYMDLAKYLAILQKRSLFFPRATQLGDPFEGSSTKLMVELREQSVKNNPTMAAAYKQMGQVFKGMVQNYLISCWHMNEHESAAMWSLYLRSNEGVCIQSTYRRLRSCLPKCVFIGEVKYIDYHTDGFPMTNAFNSIMHKRKSYEHERELRAVFWEIDGTPGAQSYKTRIEPAGLWVEVNLPSLIETIRISPAAEPWLAKVIQDVTAKYDLNVPVLQSALAESPLY